MPVHPRQRLVPRELDDSLQRFVDADREQGESIRGAARRPARAAPATRRRSAGTRSPRSRSAPPGRRRPTGDPPTRPAACRPSPAMPPRRSRAGCRGSGSLRPPRTSAGMDAKGLSGSCAGANASCSTPALRPAAGLESAPPPLLADAGAATRSRWRTASGRRQRSTAPWHAPPGRQRSPPSVRRTRRSPAPSTARSARTSDRHPTAS